MADNRKDVELRIRARDYSQKTFKELTRVYKTLIDVQQTQQDASKRGEVTNRQLESTYKRLEDAGRALLKLDALTKLYQKQGAAVEEASKKTAEAAERQKKLAAENAKAEKQTKRQVQQLNAANRAVEKAGKAEDRRRQSLANTAAQLERYGVEVSGISSAQQQFAKGVDQINAALERQDKALEEVSDNRAAARMRQQATDDARAQAEASDKVVNNLRRQAEQAIATAKGYRTLGRVVRSTTGSYSAVGRSVETIISPASVARQTLKGLEDQIKKTSDRSSDLVKDTKAAKSALQEMAETQRRLIGMSGLIDRYRQQIDQLRATRAEYNRSRAELRQLSAELRKTGADHTAIGQKIQLVQQRLNAASGALRNQSAAARATQQSLRTAGIATNKLADAENRLVKSAQSSVAASNQINQAMKRQTASTQNAARMTEFFNRTNRESLSMYQRIRGEIIAMTTAYVGVMGAVNLASGAVDAYKTRQQAMIKLSAVVGDSQQAQAAEWEYIEGLADALGIRIEDLASSYSKFAISGKEVGLTLQETKFIFESVAKAARVFQLSAEDTRGAMKAIEQMLGKGQVFAEELRGQLGERLPAAVALFAKGMGVTIADLQKKLEMGEVSAQEVINFARAQGDAIADQLDAAAESVDAAEQRLSNAQFQFRLGIADSGFIDAYTNMITKLTDFLKSEEGTVLAEKLGEAFIAVADAIIWATENTDTLANIFMTLLGLQVGKWLIGISANMFSIAGGAIAAFRGANKLAGGLGKTATGSSRAAGALGMLTKGMKLFARLIPGIGLALIAWDLGSYFYEHSETAKKAIDSIMVGIKKLPHTLMTVARSLPALLKDIIENPMGIIRQGIAAHLGALAEGIAALLKMIPGVSDEMVDSATSDLKKFLKGNSDTFTETKRIWKEAGKEWDQRQAEMAKASKEALDKVVKDTEEAADQVKGIDFAFTEDPGTGPTPREREIAALNKEIDKLSAKADKAHASVRKMIARRDLPGRLKLIDEEFAPIMERAQSVGGAEQEELVANLQKVIELRKEIERLEFESLQNGSDDKRAARIRRLTAAYEQLEAKVGSMQAKIDPNKTFNDRLVANIAKVEAQYAKLIARAQEIGGSEGNLLEKQLTDLQKVNEELVAQQTRQEEIKHLNDQLNNQLKMKKNLVAEANSLEEAGQISEAERAEKIRSINDETNEGLKERMDQLRQFAEEMKDDLTPEQLAEINAELAAMEAELSSVTGTFTDMDKMLSEGILEGIQTSFQSIATEIAMAEAGVQSWKEALQNMGVTVARFFADFLMKISQAILKQMILNALANAGFGGMSNAAVSMGGALNAAVNHSGGTVGDKSSGSGSRSRGSVPASWFANAPRYHNGGLPGLKSDEVPTILQKGEEVLSKDDPNNVLNQKGKGPAGGQQPMSARFVLVDDRSKVPEAMNSPEGEQVFTEYLSRNALSVRQILGVG